MGLILVCIIAVLTLLVACMKNNARTKVTPQMRALSGMDFSSPMAGFAHEYERLQKEVEAARIRERLANVELAINEAMSFDIVVAAPMTHTAYVAYQDACDGDNRDDSFHKIGYFNDAPMKADFDWMWEMQDAHVPAEDRTDIPQAAWLL